MLLGVDDVVVRWWRDEHVMDHGRCHACIRGESRERTIYLACCGRRSHPLRRYLPADSIVYLAPPRRRDRRRFHPAAAEAQAAFLKSWYPRLPAKLATAHA